MTPVNHPVSGPALTFVLADEIARLREALAAHGTRSARTLIKSGPLRVTLVGLASGGGLKPHHADGPIMIQVLHGAIEFMSGGQQWRLVPGSIFTLAAGLTHSVESPEGAIFMLTVAATGAHVPDPGQL